jgi:hypothetical protein
MKKGRLLVLVPALAFAAASAKGPETSEKAWSLSVPLAAQGALSIENLLGSVRVRGTSAAEAAKVDVRVVSEARSAAVAASLAGGVTVDLASDGAGTTIRVGLPADESASSLRLPDAPGPAVARLVSSVFGRKNEDLDVPYRGRSYRIADDRGIPGLAVELDITIPFGTPVAVRQEVGTVVLEVSRGEARLEALAGSIEASRFSGSLAILSRDADVKITSFQGAKLDVETRAGSIEFLDVQARRAAFRTESGPIRGKTAGAEDLAVESASGTVVLTGVEPVTAEVRTGTGNVDLSSYLTRTRKAVVRSDSGDVVLRLGEVIGFDLEAETRGGEVKALEMAMTALDRSGDVSRFRRGAGGPDLEVRAGAGSLTIRPYDVSRAGLLIRKSGR